MMEHFTVFGEQYNSQVFECIWENKRSQYCAKFDTTSITFNDIYIQVMKPTLSNCLDLLHKLHNTSFTFSDIKDFAHISNIADHLSTLYEAMNQCYSFSLPEPAHWVPQTEKDVKLYLEFFKITEQLDFANDVEQVNVAKLCLNLKVLLRVNGDFSIVNDLDAHVSSIYNNCTSTVSLV